MDDGWYLGGPINIQISDDFSHIVRVESDWCAFYFSPGLSLPIAGGKFFGRNIPIQFTDPVVEMGVMDIEGTFFDGDGDGFPEQVTGELQFASGLSCARPLSHWAATTRHPDGDYDGWNNLSEWVLGSFENAGSSTPENSTIPVSPVLGRSVCDDSLDNDQDGFVDGADETCLPIEGNDLEVRQIALRRASPGQEIIYVLEYANLGTETAENVILLLRLPYLGVYYVSGSQNAIYIPYANEVFWKLGSLLPGTIGRVTATVEFEWGLPQGAEFQSTLSIGTTSPEMDVIFPWQNPIPGLADYLAYEPPSGAPLISSAAPDEVWIEHQRVCLLTCLE
ncbi:MAG: DUF11 domain-containing protein [Chloroflexi bacterium]|nr:DUF11 domain-containing protein [Chloroflexota bacterium]